MAMIDMKLDKSDAQEEAGITPSDLPEYPYGLQITLNDETLEKLGLTQPPGVGTKVQITAMATVTGVRSYQIQTETEAGEAPENTDTSVDLQITALELGTGGSQAATTAALYKS